MRTTPEGIQYSIELDDNGITLLVYDCNMVPTRLQGFMHVHEVLEFVGDDETDIRVWLSQMGRRKK